MKTISYILLLIIRTIYYRIMYGQPMHMASDTEQYRLLHVIHLTTHNGCW